MIRYDMVTNYRCGTSVEELEPSDDGEWVRYEDVQDENDMLRAHAGQFEDLLHWQKDLTRLVRAVGEVLDCEAVMCCHCATVLRDAIAPALAKETP